MKQYKHKTENATAELCSDEYWYLIKYFDKNENEINRFSIPKSLIENTNDWEEIKPEPQEEVIEGYVRNKAVDNLRYIHSHINFSEKQTEKNNISARLILNPKPRKEYVRWVMKEFIENLKHNYPIYRVISTESDNEKYCHKIKIIVEEE